MVTEDFLFHLSREELLAMNSEHNGDMAGYLRRIVDARKASAIMAEMQAIVLRAYGKKSEDGATFVKSSELRGEFVISQAYMQLMDELSHDAREATRFVNGVLSD